MNNSFALPDKNLIAIETSSPHCIVAGCTRDGIVVAKSAANPLSHSEELLPLIDSVRETLQLSLRELDGIILGVGPGSFTGLRIGFSIIQGIATVVPVPLYPVSSLLSFAAPHLLQGVRVLSISDARRSECFSAVYERDGNSVACVLEEAIRTPAELDLYIGSVSADALIVTAPTPIEGVPISVSLADTEAVGRGLLQLAGCTEMENAKISGDAVFALEPSYIRPVAARTIAERTGIGS